jgi:DNA polymerase I-like protein with 3'-5' exonuclease and polymerase domains
MLMRSEATQALASFGFRKAWVIDSEYQQPPGERPTPWCIVAHCLITGETLRLWVGDNVKPRCPFALDGSELFIAWAADADIGALLALGWPPPLCVVDLYAEHIRARNGLPRQDKKDGLLQALSYFNEDAIGVEEKESMRALAIRGAPFTEQEKKDLLAYCQSDVDATERLFFRVWHKASLYNPKTFKQTIWRGRYLGAVAVMRAIGVPLDTALLQRLTHHWAELKLALIDKYGSRYGVYADGHFKHKLFAEFLEQWELLSLWPRTRSGRLAMDDDTFEDMADKFPRVAGGALKQLRQLRYIQSKLKLIKLEVGSDGRNRVYLAPFRTKTSRNAPTNSGFIYGPFKGLRNLIKPPRGRALAICDWAAQEFGTAAALSGDGAMWEVYATGDPHLATAKWFGLAPPDATRESHEAEREMCKALNFGVLYGMTAHGLSIRAGISIMTAENLIAQHHARFPDCRRWMERNVDKALLGYPLTTWGGWTLCYPPMSGANALARTAQNYLVQANAAEMMRYAAILATESGISVCCPIHDAFLIEASAEEIHDVEATMCRLMGDVSEIILGSGYRIEVRPDPNDKPKIFTWPHRYHEKSGLELFNTLVDEVACIESRGTDGGKRE